ncbi:MAG: acetyl-CoA carboxylase biotin carboxyl carrier protein [Saprospiraceae bacterium]|jgi:acetyl-CoA carboxylase biotin carboxyl carrier protein|nr:acetyl-CoA carboxylase biotin carboxyl carrier protein [Saprospiraceae bacterium]MDC3219941.1 acetyl-CoA carboxylase biotin carboxyl carrier protein [Saprospiraceae bacterium]MDG1434629.1 acetyl-CoA carboxylase biotin carboxyl carrier protein [Saprospiraceae bacterium]MDG2418344.1 acetyl-CoA carboxylase biotin carboxyl carrier protein [Saprospiraceae bacterium]
MKFSEIQELVKLINKSNLTEFKLKEGDFEISIRTKNYGKVRAKDIQALQSSVPQVVSVPAPMQAMAAAPAPVAAAPAPIPAEAPASENKNTLLIKSPIVGTFYRSAGPDKENYVGIGSIVEVGTVVCIVEAMKLFNEIESEVSGKIVKILVDNESPVQYDQPLFEVEPI